MKKILVTLLCLMMIITVFVACGKDSKKTNSNASGNIGGSNETVSDPAVGIPTQSTSQETSNQTTTSSVSTPSYSSETISDIWDIWGDVSLEVEGSPN